MIKLHLLGYHEFYGGLGPDGGINPYCGFHCRKCKKSWNPERTGGKIGLFEVNDLSWQTDADFKGSGRVFIGRMTIEEFLEMLNK